MNRKPSPPIHRLTHLPDSEDGLRGRTQRLAAAAQSAPESTLGEVIQPKQAWSCKRSALADGRCKRFQTEIASKRQPGSGVILHGIERPASLQQRPAKPGGCALIRAPRIPDSHTLPGRVSSKRIVYHGTQVARSSAMARRISMTHA
jgi:hypothetical protein